MGLIRVVGEGVCPELTGLCVWGLIRAEGTLTHVQGLTRLREP